MFSLKKLWLSAVIVTLAELCTINPLQALTLNFKSTDGSVTGSFTTLDNRVFSQNFMEVFDVQYLRLSSTTSNFPFSSMYAYRPMGISRVYPESDGGRVLMQQEIFVTKGIGPWFPGTPETDPPSVNFTGIYLSFWITFKCPESILNCLGASGKMSISYDGSIIQLPWSEKPLVVTGYEEPTSPHHSVPEPSSLLGLLLLGGGWLLDCKRREKLPRNSASL